MSNRQIVILSPNTPRNNVDDGSEDLIEPPESVPIGKGRGRDSDRDGANNRGEPLLSVAEFKAKHQLRAIADYGRLKIAVTTAESWVRENDTVDGCHILSVTSTSVRFSCFDGETRYAAFR